MVRPDKRLQSDHDWRTKAWSPAIESYHRAIQSLKAPQSRTIAENNLESVARPPESEDKALTVRPGGEPFRLVDKQRLGCGEFVLLSSFVPFLIYFMLSWKDRTRAATVKLFRAESRNKVYAALNGIGSMFRAFAVGNPFCGLFMSLVSVAAFGLLGLPYFYFLGFISGFLSLRSS